MRGFAVAAPGGGLACEHGGAPGPEPHAGILELPNGGLEVRSRLCRLLRGKEEPALRAPDARPAETFVAGRRLPSVVQGLPRIPHGEPRGAPPDSPAAPHPRLRRHALELVERTVEASGERVDAIPDLVVEDVPGDEPVALVQGLR